jgi:hypothetical protein
MKVEVLDGGALRSLSFVYFQFCNRRKRMKKSDDPGIDYSGIGGTCNRDHETGIRYGIISQNSMDQELLIDIYNTGEDLGFADDKTNLLDELKNAIIGAIEEYGDIDEDEAFRAAGEIVDSDLFVWHDRDESGPYLYEEPGLKVQTTSDNNLWVFKSPFYTRAQFCSPCVPGAGNLDTFCPDGPKTYCLPADWFEDGKAPYNIWSVETDEMVYAVPGYFGGEIDEKGLPV